MFLLSAKIYLFEKFNTHFIVSPDPGPVLQQVVTGGS